MLVCLCNSKQSRVIGPESLQIQGSGHKRRPNTKAQIPQPPQWPWVGYLTPTVQPSVYGLRIELCGFNGTPVHLKRDDAQLAALAYFKSRAGIGIGSFFNPLSIQRSFHGTFFLRYGIL